MSYLHDYMGLLGCLLLLIAVPLTKFKQPRFKRRTITIVIFFMMGLSVIPIYELSVLEYIRAVLADLSITSLILLCIMIASAYSGRQYIQAGNHRRMDNSIIVAALILYPLGLGLTPYDTYAAGYGSPVMYFLLVTFAGYLFWQQSYFVLGLLLLGTGAYITGILQSNNLWDYLIDPWLALWVITRKGRQLLEQATSRKINQ